MVGIFLTLCYSGGPPSGSKHPAQKKTIEQVCGVNVGVFRGKGKGGRVKRFPPYIRKTCPPLYTKHWVDHICFCHANNARNTFRSSKLNSDTITVDGSFFGCCPLQYYALAKGRKACDGFRCCQVGNHALQKHVVRSDFSFSRRK